MDFAPIFCASCHAFSGCIRLFCVFVFLPLADAIMNFHLPFQYTDHLYIYPILPYEDFSISASSYSLDCSSEPNEFFFPPNFRQVPSAHPNVTFGKARKPQLGKVSIWKSVEAPTIPAADRDHGSVGPRLRGRPHCSFQMRRGAHVRVRVDGGARAVSRAFRS